MKVAYISYSFILASQAKQVFYVQDQLEPRWSIVLSIPQKEFLHKEDVDELVEVSIEHHPSISALPKYIHLMIWMTLNQYACGIMVKGFGLKTNLPCDSISSFPNDVT